MEDNCDICDEKLVKAGEKIIGSVNYTVLRCDKCKKQFMRREE